MAAIAIDAESCKRRLERLFAVWDHMFDKPGSSFHGVEAISVISGKSSDEASEGKTSAVHLWLLGYDFPDTLMVLTRKRDVYFLTKAKKLAHLNQIKTTLDGVHLLTSSPEDNPANFKTIVDALKGDDENGVSMEERRVGVITKETHEGSFASDWQQQLEQSGVPQTPINEGLSLVMCVKEECERESIKKASQVSCSIYKDVLVDMIEDTLDKEVKKTHKDIAAKADNSIESDKITKRWKEKFAIDKDDIDVAFTTVQSGGKYELKASSEPTKDNLCLTGGCLIVGCGAKYKEYNSAIIRTLIVNPTAEQKDMYTVLTQAFDALVKALRPGAKFRDVYEAARQVVVNKSPALETHFVKSVGSCLGIEFRDSAFTLNGKSDKTVLPGMAFSVQVGLSDMKPKRGKGDMYAIWITDTLVVPLPDKPQPSDTDMVNGDGGGGAAGGGGAGHDDLLVRCLVQDEEVMAEASKLEPVVLTASQKRSLQANSYELEEEEAEDEEDERRAARPSDGKKGNKKKDKKGATGGDGPAVSASVLKNADTVVMSQRLRTRKGELNEEESKEIERKQQELRFKKLQAIRDRFQNGEGEGAGAKKVSVRKMSSITTYQDAGSLPREVERRPNKILLDGDREAVLVPLGGTHVPFHVSTIKNVSCVAEEGKKHSLRINFQVPGSMGQTFKADENPLPDLSDSNSLFIKELVYRTEDERAMNETFRRMKELIKKVKAKQTLEDQKRDLVEQATLQINRSGKSRPILKELMVRPNVSGSRKVIGNLEAHLNGLRFSAARASENVDIIYANIKHMILQPCVKDLIVLIHFHLHNPIMVGKKKTFDVQFFREVGSQADDLDMRRGGRSGYDPDEIAEEEREQRQKKDLNDKFQRFAKDVESLTEKEFDMPYRELAFTGVPNKSNVTILPTVNCLVHLTEWPPFVLTLEDIEIVSFERVMHGLKNFDMVFVFEDYAKAPKKIDSIPTENLDTLKKWLNELDIVWYEGKQNLNWPNILKTIKDDVEGFVEQGGFDYFLGEEDESEEDDDDEEEDEYKDEEDESAEEEDESSDDDESLAEESDESDFQDLDSDEEEGKDWDELEAEAAKEDKKKRELEDQPASRHKRKRK
ncbi:unnamed protein product [Vitrella brassicaformis CCMP3155]|uniref:FACT complex subunit n=1 Tax=Vitrella brassicaformis (strain CCMP3155) TaxID=1169540 RepID=A0A0G4EYN6_VITBC|nr:unnamed protein product [Vitrella brassicaformis CCMP3155]|mmetsp:Transcript_33656/g.97077  ORF Transcript_33656/g.97077 Transcript_33656/m.97077 type:complete len:1109 (+) Transcript_33656:104-3430(+)|eukprot:CEM04056.1 unnamed protein product [Vitrella brassicaformis CCMP3155]